MVVAGGTEAAIMALNIGAFAVMRAMSTRNDEPERASRPFDKGRDGFVLGEGAGMVVLESLAHALARGARIYAVAAGAGYTSDGYHISHGAPDGAGRGARHPVRHWPTPAVQPSQVVHINAHATSTPEGDPLEAKAIAKALGDAAARVRGVLHQVDDRAPARRARARWRLSPRPGLAGPDRAAHHQPGRPRR